VAIVLALLAAAGWGSSDYAAGVASRRSSALSVVVLTHCVAAVLLAVALLGPFPWGGTTLSLHYLPTGSGERSRLTLELLLPAGAPGRASVVPFAPVADLLWGAAGGVSGGLGAVLLFRGLARGAVHVVAPVTAVVAAVLPVVAGVLTGESLGVAGSLAVAVALVAVVLISEPASPPARHARRARRTRLGPFGTGPRRRSAHGRHRAVLGGGEAFAGWATRRLGRPGMVEALGSGLGFGGFYLLLGRTGDAAGLWPILSARTASVLLFATAALVTRERLLPRRGDRGVVLVAGVLDAFAAAVFLAATRQGLLSVVAVLSSLYPAATIALARLVDHERCSRNQWAGLGLAAVSVGVLAVS
jgi:drug/metabolite transporter (DMT)-like permease